MKLGLCKASFNQQFVGDAPVVIVCCGDLLSWKETKERSQELLAHVDVQLTNDCKYALMKRIDKAINAKMHERIPTTLLNVAIAIEHMVLEAVELGLASCWVRLFDGEKIRQLLALPENLYVVALLPIGVPDEEPKPRPRMPASAIIVNADC